MHVVPAYLRVGCAYRSYSPDWRQGLRHGASRAAVRRPAIGGEDLASTASKPWGSYLAARAWPRAVRRAWFLTWRSGTPTGAQGRATAQPRA